MSITINNKHWLVADWIMRNLFKDIIFEIENSYEKHDTLKEKIHRSINLHTYSLVFDNKNEIQSIADLGFLIKKAEQRKNHNRSTEEIISDSEVVYISKISELKSLVESNFKSNNSDIKFDSERLEKEYRNSIWLYLEKLTYYLIYLNKELKPNSDNSELIDIDNYETNFSIKYFGEQDDLINKKLFQNLIKLIPRNQSLISAILYLGKDQNSGIVNYGNHKMENDSEKISKFQRVFKIRQEWGGSYWKVRFTSTKDNEFDAMLYQEINKFKMEFKFKLNENPAHNRVGGSTPK